METYKQRNIEPNQRVKVYFNLRKKKFSIVPLEGPFKGKVACHTENIRLKNCEFRVNEKGRQEVLKTRQKNVHAFVYGDFLGEDTKKGEEVFYNPYLYDSFVDKAQNPLLAHPEVSLSHKKMFLN